MPHEFIVDRSLGNRVPRLLRDGGFNLHTLADVYGEHGAMAIADVDWIERAARDGWAALSKDGRIGRVPIERNALMTHRVPLFALTNANLNITEMVDAYLLAQPSIIGVLDTDPGGGMWSVDRAGKVRRRWPPE